jgi:signal transduction histidine kinase
MKYCRMIRKRFAIGAGLLVAWTTFAAWQYQRLGYERELIGESTRHSARSVMSALIGGIQSHRRLGRFFEQQLESMLVEVTGSGEVLAAAVLNEQGEPLMRAGQLDLLAGRGEVAPGDSWSDDGFRLVERFHIDPVDQGGQGWGPGGYGGSGLGGGRGLGRRQEYGDIPEPFGAGGTFYAILVLDRARHDQLVRRSEWSFVFVSLAGALVLVSVAVAWRTSVRLVEAKGREKLLETETRHWRELSQAAAGLAHETRNPLGLIRGWTQRLAHNDADPATQQRHALAVIEECDRVTARINHFLAFARPCEPKPEPMDAGSMVEQLRIILQPDLEAKRLRLDFEPERDAVCILADRELLRQMLFNLLQNAIQFAPEGTVVTIGLKAERPGTFRLTVADRGPGVDAGIEEAIFAPYFTTRPGGTGLGLAIVRRIALANGWTVHYAPWPGGGAVFSLGGIHGSEQTNHPGRGRRTEPTATAG